MAPERKPEVYRGFGELASALYPQLAERPPAPRDEPPDYLAKLRAERVDETRFPALGAHAFAEEAAWPAQRAAAAAELGDAIFASGFGERWPMYAGEAYQALADGLAALLAAGAEGTTFTVEFPGLARSPVEGAAYPELPPDFAFKGGVARKALARALRLNRVQSAVRDLDIVSFAARRDHAVEDRLQRCYMQDDWLFARERARQKRPRGKKRAAHVSIIEWQANLKAYFKTREFSVNEVALQGGQVVCTLQCAADLLGGVVRVTHNHFKKNQGRVDGMVAVKAARFHAECLAEGSAAPLGAFVVSPRRPVTPFHFALHFARALERGEPVARAYCEVCEERGLAPCPLTGDLEANIARAAKAAELPRTFFPALDGARGEPPRDRPPAPK